MVFFVRITVNQSHLRPICKSTKFNPKIQRTIYLINFQQLRLHVPDFIRTVVIFLSRIVILPYQPVISLITKLLGVWQFFIFRGHLPYIAMKSAIFGRF